MPELEHQQRPDPLVVVVRAGRVAVEQAARPRPGGSSRGRASRGRAAPRATTRAGRRAASSTSGTLKPCFGRSRISSGSQPRSASRRIHFFSRPRTLQRGGNRRGELHQLVVEERRARLERRRPSSRCRSSRSGRRPGRCRRRPRASGRRRSRPRLLAQDAAIARSPASPAPAANVGRVELAALRRGRTTTCSSRSAPGRRAPSAPREAARLVLQAADVGRRSGSRAASRGDGAAQRRRDRVEPAGERGWRRSACSRRRTRRRRRR